MSDIEPTDAERKLLDALARDEAADFTTGDAAKDDPRGEAEWGAERMLRAEFLSLVCTRRRPGCTIPQHGLQIVGAEIRGRLDLSVAEMPFPIAMIRCRFSESLGLSHACILLLDLTGSRTRALNADGATVKGDVFMGGGFAAEGEVFLLGAEIGGQFHCAGGTFKSPNGVALNADGATVKGDVFMGQGFAAEGEVRLLGAEMAGAWDCTAGSFKNPGGKALSADRATVKGDVFMAQGFAAEGEVRLLGAEMGGAWDCTGGSFKNRGGIALGADRATVKGSVFMRRGRRRAFVAEGEVRLLGTEIGGQWDCTGGCFKNPGESALTADGATVKGRVLMRQGFAAEGEVCLLGAEIGGQWVCTGGTFKNQNVPALNADGATVKGGVVMRQGFAAEGEVRLLGVEIGGQWRCTGGKFTNPDGVALGADRATVKHDVLMREGFAAEGEVRLPGAEIGGQWDCTGGSFKNPKGVALGADQAKVKGGVFMRERFAAEGEVRLPGAEIGSQWDCTGGNFKKSGGVALRADGATVNGGVVMGEGFAAEGAVHLLGTEIAGVWDCTGGSFENPGGAALGAEGARIASSLLFGSVTVVGSVLLGHATITGALLWQGVTMTGGMADLQGARIGALRDDGRSWPHRINLNGLVFEAFGGGAPTDARTRIKWLGKQIRDAGAFFPQPYEQVIKVLRAMGHERDARRVGIEKQEALWRSGALGFWAGLMNLFLGATIGHGYRSWLALIWIVAVIGLGWWGFGTAHETGAMIPTASPEPYTFSALMYSADVFLPIIDFHQTEFWLPDPEHGIGRRVLIYMWFHNLFGWVFTTVFVAAVTGIVKRD